MADRDKVMVELIPLVLEEDKQYGAYFVMGFITKDEFLSRISEAAEKLLDQMHRSVESEKDIKIIFGLQKTEDPDVFHCMASWKCTGKPKEGELE